MVHDLTRPGPRPGEFYQNIYGLQLAQLWESIGPLLVGDTRWLETPVGWMHPLESTRWLRSKPILDFAG